MERDVRGTPQYAAVSNLYSALFAPGQDHVHAARDLQAGGNGTFYFTGLRFDGSLEDGPSESLYRFDLADARLTLLQPDARLFRPSPDGRSGAFAIEGGVEIVSLDDFSRLDHCPIPGIVEQMHWSPDGTALAMLVAGAHADVSGAEGGFALRTPAEGPAWLPEVDEGDAEDVWRRLWLWRPGESPPAPLTHPPVNVWEASWKGAGAIAVVTSNHHGEGSWYESRLAEVDIATGALTELHVPADQMAYPAGSPDGAAVAFVEAVCSDRGIVCGTLRLVDSGGARTLDTNGVEVTNIHWRGNGRIHYAGLRGFETVVGEHDLATGTASDIWASQSLTCGEWYPVTFPDGEGGAFIFAEGYDQAPVLARVEAGEMEVLHNFASPIPVPDVGVMEPIRWQARDGLEIYGWLIRPRDSKGNHPLLIDVHGGPIWSHRNRWMRALRSAPLLVQKGYAVLLPNMRGASGRGQDFARMVVGDMGGEDMHDLLRAVDHLVGEGIVDPKRVAITGNSYGGFMSSWIITQDDRFAAAVPISPVANWYSQHFTSQIPSFDELCVQGSPKEAGGQYFERSPVFFADRVKTPTLILTGALDKNTPPTQALEFHRGLLEAGATSVLCTYPEHGHSLRGYPAYLDSAARILIWLDRYLGMKGQ